MVENYTSLYKKLKVLKADVAFIDYAYVYNNHCLYNKSPDIQR